MKTSRVVYGALLLAGFVGSARAQPQKALQAVADQFWEAGNYTWVERKLVDWSNGSMGLPKIPPMGSGETVIDGFTVATIQGRHLVLLGQQAAFELKAGWRYAKDLTDEETTELGTYRGGLPTADQRARNYTHALPHEVLKIALAMAANIREGNNVILADLVGTSDQFARLEDYILFGRAASLPTPRSTSLFPSIIPPPGMSGRQTEYKGALTVGLTKGTIDLFSVEVTKSRRISLNGGPPENHTAVQAYQYELSNVGRTKVEVDPEARALFAGAPP